jgi:small nuclear ribonucleoprotein D1
MKLVKFLQKLNREQVTIELKNGTVISGTVVGVDATMNAHLKKAKMTARGKNPVSYATLSVRGSTVRAWLLPDGLNLDALLVEESTKVRVYFDGRNTWQFFSIFGLTFNLDSGCSVSIVRLVPMFSKIPF